MWSRHKAGGSDGKIKREVAMSEQADLVLKKKAEIEAKMAAEEKINKRKSTERKEKKPLSLSASKRWGLKGKKCGAVSVSGSVSLPTPSTPLICPPPTKSSISFNISTNSSLNGAIMPNPGQDSAAG